MLEYRIHVGEGGRVVIPSSIRKELRIEVGDELIFKVEKGKIFVSTLKSAIENAQSIVKKYNPKRKKLTDQLFRMRKEESRYD